MAARPAMPKLLFDFRDPAAVLAWRPIDDRVMGGASQSRLYHHPDGHAVFEGEVSLARNGGFASVRAGAADRGLAGARHCVIDVRGEGRTFTLGLLTDDGFDRPAHQARFVPDGPGWQTLHLPLAAFRARFRGREIDDAPPLDPARVRQVGLLVADRQPGPFTLDVRCIALA